MTAPDRGGGRRIAPTSGGAGRAPGPPAPATKAARQARIAAILSREQVRSQEELAELLARYGGTHVAQATLSRDLDELGVVRLRGADGFLVYALPEEPGGPGSRPGAGLGLDAETGWAASPEPGSPGPVAPPRSARSTSVNVPGAPAGEASGEAGGGAPAAGHSGSQPDASDYRARSSRLARYLVELLTSAEASANLVVLRTPAGAAQFLASVIDHAVWPSILGTVAGDDTVLVITRDPAGGDALAAEFLRLAERRRLFLGGGPEGHPPDPPARCGSRRIITRPGGPRPSAGTRSRNVSRGRGSLRVHPP